MRETAFGLRVAILTAVASTLVLSACGDVQPGMTAEESPQQPIEFMHTVHVGEDQIACAYCHFSASESEEAGIPAVGTCMGCHRFIAGSTEERQAEITKLREFWADSTAIPWVRVHSVPEFVQFTHKPHLRAGVTCASCHGDVASMVRVRRVESLSMGWCLDCHRSRGASDDCAVCHY